MNRKTVLAISMAAIFTLAVAVPLNAEAILDLVQTEIKIKDGEISKLRFEATDKIESDPFGGYAILTDADPVTAIAFTSHGGFYDSIVQGPGDNLDTPHVDFPGKAALCSTPTGCGPEWHVHIVEPAVDLRCASGLAVGELTWEEPSERQKVAGANLIARSIPLGDNTYEAALAGGDRTFDAGTNIDTAQAGLAFPLTGIFTQTDPFDPTSLVGVCIGPLAPVP
jgi:hypothetical protein